MSENGGKCHACIEIILHKSERCFTWLLIFWKLLHKLPFVLVLVNLQFVDILKLRCGLDLTENVFDSPVGRLQDLKKDM